METEEGLHIPTTSEEVQLGDWLQDPDLPMIMGPVVGFAKTKQGSVYVIESLMNGRTIIFVGGAIPLGYPQARV